ncbi:MAG: hypothetical protein WCJ33_01470 [Pseudomonadota bacterium]
MGYGRWGSFAPYVSVAERKQQALKQIEKLKKKGEFILPVTITGKAIAESFWGKSWCKNLELYSDYENRLPRGRSYVRNGSVIDLKIHPGGITAKVLGSSLYKVSITITEVAKRKWEAICNDCAGSINSLIELLQGKLSENVMERVCRKEDGLFPAPKEIKMSCSCPDGVGMCKHIAATLYGVGTRLDSNPDFLFLLRNVDEKELIAKASKSLSVGETISDSERVMGGDDDLSELFGIDMVGIDKGEEVAKPKKSIGKPAKKILNSPKKPTKKKTTANKTKVKEASTKKAKSTSTKLKKVIKNP